MKVLIITSHFWPESFRINDLALGLKERGVEVEVLTGKPNYPAGKYYKGYTFFSKFKELWDGINISRINVVPRGSGSGIRLAINYLSFVFLGSIRTLFIKERFDKVFVFGTSPVTVCIPAIVYAKRKRVPVYFWVQDLWPESVSAVGMIRNKAVINFFNNLTKWIYKNCSKLLIQSEGFADYIQGQNVSADKLIYFPNSTESLYKPVEANDCVKALMDFDGFKLLFAGNIGEAQDFENVLKAVQRVVAVNKKFHFFVVGDGRKINFVKDEVFNNGLELNVHLLGSFPVVDMPHFFSVADALLVSLKDENIFNLTIPSKVQSYLACAKPIIGALNGTGANIIKQSNSGIISPASNPELLAENILEFMTYSLEKRSEMGKNGRKFFETNFERELLLSKLMKIMEC